MRRDKEIRDIALVPKENVMWVYILDERSYSSWAVSDVKIAVEYLQAWLSTQEKKDKE